MTKLDKVMKLLQEQYSIMKECYEKDWEYTSLDGNGCNGFEVFLAFEPIYNRALKIYDS